MACHLFSGGDEEGPDSCVPRSAPPSSLPVGVSLLLLLLVLAEVAAASSSCPLAAGVSVAQSSVLASVSPPVAGQQLGSSWPAEMACCHQAEKLIVGRVGGN